MKNLVKLYKESIESVGYVRTIAPIVGVMVLLLVLFFGISTIITPKVKVEASVEVTSTLPAFTAADGLDVLLNMYTNVDQACFSNNQYLVHFEDGKDENWHGWYLFKEYDFHQLANGTWYHPNMPASNLVSITNVETKGLECVKSAGTP